MRLANLNDEYYLLAGAPLRRIKITKELYLQLQECLVEEDNWRHKREDTKAQMSNGMLDTFPY